MMALCRLLERLDKQMSDEKCRFITAFIDCSTKQENAVPLTEQHVLYCKIVADVTVGIEQYIWV